MDNTPETDGMETVESPKGESWGEVFKTIFYAVVVAVVVRTFLFEPFNIPSGSMKSTLLIGDYLFVSKYSYGYSRFSFPLNLPLVSDRVMFTEPKRGDVIVFRLPKDVNINYIKRLIGLPGDTIQLKNSILYINGTAVKRERIGEYIENIGDNRIRRVAQYRETLPGGKVHNILEYTDNLPSNYTLSDNTPLYTIPPGHYFGMGDNRDKSQDSRYLNDVGFIPKENLIGRAEVIFFSIDGSFLKFWNWFTSLRFTRFFTGIE